MVTERENLNIEIWALIEDVVGGVQEQKKRKVKMNDPFVGLIEIEVDE